VTVRHRSYRSLASLQRDTSRCRACAEAGFQLESLPVRAPLAGWQPRRRSRRGPAGEQGGASGADGQRAYIFGQAPGVVEGRERLPWRGRAGQALRRWLDLDEETFYATFYCASVTRCYPGRAPSGRGDRTPTRREQELCEFWRDRELELLRPRLIVSVGGLALRRLLGPRQLTECVGERLERGGAVLIALPHPSGASGWLNVPANRERLAAATALVREELARLSP